MTSSFAFKTVSSLSETLFPGITQTFGYENSSRSDKTLPGNEIVSSLPLQMSLYFNCFFFPLWLIANLLMLSLKYSYLTELYKIALITALIVVALIEVIRLYLGYLGNLTEKVPELAGFWLLTCLLQFPLQGFLLFNEDAIILPFERALNIVMISFVIFEIIFGYLAIKVLARQQVTKFHLNLRDNVADSVEDIGHEHRE